MNHPVVMLGVIVPAWLIAGLAAVAWIAVCWIAKGLLLRQLSRLAAKIAFLWDEALIRSMHIPLNILILGSGIIIGGRLLAFSPETHQALAQALKALLILVLMLIAHGLARELIRIYAPRAEFLQAYRGLIQGIAQTLVLLLGGLILLDSFGISITPILASLGIGSLAVALALQDTLANLFAGIHILADKPVLVGQFVKLDNGDEGYVIHIGWRSTRIRTLPNSVVIVPNSKLAGAIVTNYHYPDKELAVLVEVGVHYKSDLEHVERVTSAVAKDTLQQVPGGVATFEPFIRYHTLGESSIGFTVILRAKEFTDQYLLKHEFIKRLHVRYKQEGIVIPFPIRTLDVNRADLELLRQQS